MNVIICCKLILSNPLILSALLFFINMQIIINCNGNRFRAIRGLHNILSHFYMLINMNHILFLSCRAAFPFFNDEPQSA
ncbi:hypothetical protein Hanom_Chr08g00747851 [Helianthus anomalus]